MTNKFMLDILLVITNVLHGYDDLGTMETLLNLLAEKLGVEPDDNLRESVHYILSIPDVDDQREWLEDGMGLNNSEDVVAVLSEIERTKRVATEKERPEKSRVVVSAHKKTTPTRLVGTSEQSFQESVAVSAPKPRLPPAPDSVKAKRSMCGCLGKSEYPGGHRVIGNCLSCGRIICAEEDYGECLSCGEPKSGSMHWIGYATSHNLESPGLDSTAVDQKDRLIQYDREGTSRTRVYDDSTDWFAESQDVWRGREEREEAKRIMAEFEEQKHEAKKQIKISLDFNAGSISVVDKEGEMKKIEKQHEEALDRFIATTVERSSGNGNILDESQEKILREIREKLGAKEPSNTREYTSLMSVFDDLG
jgi:hypothetical protein